MRRACQSPCLLLLIGALVRRLVSVLVFATWLLDQHAKGVEIAGRLAPSGTPRPFAPDRGRKAHPNDGVERAVGVLEDGTENPIDLVTRDCVKWHVSRKIDVAQRIQRERDAVHPCVSLKQPTMNLVVRLVGTTRDECLH